MDIKEAIRAGLQELILPQLKRLEDDNLQIRTILDLTNKRLDDVNAHLVDQSRRIDTLRTEIKSEIQELRTELKGDIQDLRTELKGEIHELRTDLKEEIHALSLRMDLMNKRLDDQGARMDRMSEAMVRREEQERLTQRIISLEHKYHFVEQRLAA